jgi:hypothetical protein
MSAKLYHITSQKTINFVLLNIIRPSVFHNSYKVLLFSINRTNFLLLKYIQGGEMFRLYRAIIRPYLKNRSISFFCKFGILCVYIDNEVITYALLFFTLRIITSFKILLKSMSI